MRAVPCCADPPRRSELTRHHFLGGVNESEPKHAVLALETYIWDHDHLPFVQETMSVTWSGVEILKASEIWEETCDFWLSCSFMSGSSLALSWTLVATNVDSVVVCYRCLFSELWEELESSGECEEEVDERNTTKALEVAILFERSHPYSNHHSYWHTYCTYQLRAHFGPHFVIAL